jgi:hypothetical protein
MVATRLSFAIVIVTEQTSTCDSSTAVTTYPLEEDWAFRIDTCEGPTYWRCWYKRHSAGRDLRRGAVTWSIARPTRSTDWEMKGFHGNTNP